MTTDMTRQVGVNIREPVLYYDNSINNNRNYAKNNNNNGSMQNNSSIIESRVLETQARLQKIKKQTQQIMSNKGMYYNT